MNAIDRPGQPGRDGRADAPAASGAGDSRDDAKPSRCCMGRRAQIVALGVGLFVIGACLGSLVTAHALHRGMRRAFKDPDTLASRMLDHMRRDLDLTDEQAAQVLVVLKKHHRAIRDTVVGEIDSMHEEILPLLNEEQAARLKETHAERRGRLFGGPEGSVR